MEQRTRKLHLKKLKILRFSKLRATTKVLSLSGVDTKLILVGIVRERLFGKVTIEEAMKVVDTVSCRPEGHINMKVLIGINDLDYQLIHKSMSSRNGLKGKFMSPLVALCHQSGIETDWIARRMSSTSSRLSQISFWNPLQFYRACWILLSKSWALVRTPQALPYLQRSVPMYVQKFLEEGSACMALKILKSTEQSPTKTHIAVVPYENFDRVSEILSARSIPIYENVDSDIRSLEEDASGSWLLVFGLYILVPVIFTFELIKVLSSSKLRDLSNFETQGIALGTWMRDTRRD